VHTFLAFGLPGDPSIVQDLTDEYPAARGPTLLGQEQLGLQQSQYRVVPASPSHVIGVGDVAGGASVVVAGGASVVVAGGASVVGSLVGSIVASGSSVGSGVGVAGASEGEGVAGAFVVVAGGGVLLLQFHPAPGQDFRHCE